MTTKLIVVLLIASVSAVLDFTNTGKSGIPINQISCNPDTTLQFKFSSSTVVNSQASTYSITQKQFSSMKFLDVYGNDLNLLLTDYSYDIAAGGFTTGLYSNAPQGAHIFEFSDGTNNVYLYIPTTVASIPADQTQVDLTSPLAPSNSLKSFTGTGALSPFNFIDMTDYNQFYTLTAGKNTLLASKFYYRVSNAPTQTGTALYTKMSAILWQSNYKTGDKLCYASIDTTGNFQTHIRESVPMWFIFFIIFFYWLYYLLSDSITISCYEKRFEDNKWTCWAIYSLWHLGHEEYFTRLSRSSVLLAQWSVQGVFIASMYGNQYQLGPSLIIWTAVVAYVATIPFPFIFGCSFLKKIYDKSILKYETMKQTKGVLNKAQLQPLQKQMDKLDEKLYGYYYWFYVIVFIFFWVCWPISVNMMQKLPRTHYNRHWYWLASMGIVFALEHLIFDPILACIFGNNRNYRQKGGYFYDFKLGEAYKVVQN